MLGAVHGNGSGQTIAIIDAYDAPNFVSSTDPNFANSDLYKFDHNPSDQPARPAQLREGQRDGRHNAAGGIGFERLVGGDVAGRRMGPRHRPAGQHRPVRGQCAYGFGLDYHGGQHGPKLAGSHGGFHEFWPQRKQQRRFGDLGVQHARAGTPASRSWRPRATTARRAGSRPFRPTWWPSAALRLTINASTYAWVSETGWSGSGGGQSVYEAEPSYQNGVQYQRLAADSRYLL